MKIWHDDIRRPPDDTWTWARTNAEAQILLGDYGVDPADEGGVTEISLDHDLGFHEADPDAPGAIYLRGQSEQTGFHLVDWMIAEDLVPEKVTVHSWNIDRSIQMVKTLRARGFSAVRRPYEAPGAVDLR